MERTGRIGARVALVASVATLGSLLAPTVALAAAHPAKAPVSTPGPARDYAPDRAIVGIERGERTEAVDTIEDEGGDILGFNRSGQFFVVETASDSASWTDVVEDDSAVRYAEPDWVVSAEDLAPADPSWGALWGHKQIQAPAAWRTTTGSKEVVVGVIDSGVDYRHEDLAAQMWVNPNEDPATPGDDDNNGWANDIHGIDCADNDSDPMDTSGHGTHVAGTIGAAANNNKGVAGIAWNVKIMALRFLGTDGSGYTSDAIQCLYYAIDNGAHITNNSWGGPTFSRTLQDAIRLAGSKNQLFIAAAGNNGADTGAVPQYPASYDLSNVISVAASGRDDQLATFSNYSSNSVDLAAPGVGIMSTVPGGYASYSGTSMAAPHVTGAAVLLLAADPSLRSDAPRLRSTIFDHTDPVAGLQGKVATGGRLNIGTALKPDGPQTVHMHDVATSIKKVSKQYRKATVTITVSSDHEEAVQGAQVTLAWSVGGTSTCSTDAHGTCSVSKRVKRTSVATLAVGVTAISHGSLIYDAAASHTSNQVQRFSISA